MAPHLETRVRIAAALLILVSAPVGAQEQTGSLEGTVRDTQGGILPGATVEARHAELGAPLVSVTGTDGRFRFASVAPGYYDVTATLAGFMPQRFERVEVLLGQVKRLDFMLGISGVTEEVNVVAASPLVDVKQSARGSSLREEALALLPRGLDFQAAVPLLPGANQEPKLGGLSIDGSSAAENRFIVDGMNASDVMTGTMGYPISVDSLEELQVKSSGYAAEFGGSTGGVINVLTRSGTNSWRGDAHVYFSGDALDAGPRATLRRNPQNSAVAEYIRYPEDPYTKTEAAGSIGGPLVRDRAWFFASYQPQLKRQERTVTFAVDGSTGTFAQRTFTNLVNVSQSMQLGTRLRTRAAYNGAIEPIDGVLPLQAGSDPPTAQFDIQDRNLGWSLSASADWLASGRLFVTGRVGYFHKGFERGNVREVPRYIFGRSNIGLLDVPESLQRVTGFTNERSIMAGTDRTARLGAQVDATWYVWLAGEHSLKAGLQAERTTDDLDLRQVRNAVNLQWNRSVLGQRGRYGYYIVSSNTVNPRQGMLQLGVAEGSTPGIFVQDTWTVGRRLTVNLGLRSERETVPSYGRDGQDAPPVVEFGFRDKVAPRLGAAWDVLGDGRWKAYGSWGVFYDVFKYSMSTAFGALASVYYYYTLDTYDWPTLVDPPGCPPACPGQLILGPVKSAADSETPIDPALDPMRLQEATAGVEHQLGPTISVAARYVHKQLDRAVEDIGAQDAGYNEVYTMGNPGYGVAAYAYRGVPLPKARRDYDALELTVRRLLTDGWSFNASYLWSRLYGNTSGLSQSDEEGRVSPNVGRAYDYPAMMFDEKGRPVYGPLATDRPHQFKAFGTYATSFGLTASVSQMVASGLPITRQAAILPPSYYPVMYLGRGSDGRTPTLAQTDVYVQQEFRFSRPLRLSLGISVSNLFNSGTVISVSPDETDTGSGIALNEADLYAGRLDFAQLMAQQNVVKNPLFLMARAFQAPRTIKLMARLTF